MSSVLLKKCSNLDFSPKKPNFEDLPLTVCAACLEFVGNTLEAVFVNKWFLESSYHVYCNIAKTSKGILNWQSCITVKEPSEKQSNSDSLLKWCRYYSDVVHTIHWVLVKKARTVGIKVDDPKKVCLQPLIQKIIIRRAEADYFNLFFSQVLDQNFRLLSPVKIKELENIREKILSTPMDPDDQELEKAKEVSTWMEKNKELLQNITYLRLRGLSLKTIPPRVYELLTGLRRIEFC